MTIPTDRLREIANHEVADTSERKAMAAELLAARDEHDAYVRLVASFGLLSTSHDAAIARAEKAEAERDAARVEADDHLAALRTIAGAIGNPTLCGDADKSLSHALAQEVVRQFAAARAELDRAKRALTGAGWTDNGGAEWKPPLGQGLALLRLHLAAAEAAKAALERDVGVLSRELECCLDVLNALPDAALDQVPTAKMLRAYQLVAEVVKHQFYETKVDQLTATNRALVREMESRDKAATNVRALLNKLPISDVGSSHIRFAADEAALGELLLAVVDLVGWAKPPQAGAVS